MAVQSGHEMTREAGYRSPRQSGVVPPSLAIGELASQRLGRTCFGVTAVPRGGRARTLRLGAAHQSLGVM
jgi:hypothetical protein